MLQFLTSLSLNNNREWFEKHKGEYLEVKLQMEQLIQSLLNEIADFDPSIADQNPKKCLFRIYRDVRFSKNKQPYKTNFGGFIVPGGKKSGKAGYYLHIEPGKSFLAGGVYLPEAKILKAIRQEIQYHTQEFSDLINTPTFKQLFKEIYGEKLKRPPRDFPADFPQVELLKYKSYALVHYISDEQITSHDLVPYATNIFKEMKPFHDFLNRSFIQD
ncbi:MAG: TIGR02453 family protein [Bacteroidetes bacterium 4572_77]|nr:MAG: TIGR02453 family protein [Bacteroidetes bacterium 4572_77]